MIKVKRVTLNPGKRHVVHVSEGRKVEFDADGIAIVDEALADIFSVVPGYEVERPESVKEIVEEGEEDFVVEDLAEFKNLSWQKQRDLVNKDMVSDAIISDILANGEDYTPTVVKSAEKKVK